VLVDVPAGVAFVGALDTSSAYGLYAIDLTTGDRLPVATTLVGTGDVAAARTLSRAPGNGHLRFPVGETLTEADPTTGNRVVVSGAGTGHGPRLSDDDVYVTRARPDGMVVLLDGGSCALILVDPVTGERLLLAK
jgi:hypothetical protein